MTDLDQQNNLVDSIQDEDDFEEIDIYSQKNSSYNSNQKQLLMVNHKLTDIFNRQSRLNL